jgi:hypothetical protein
MSVIVDDWAASSCAASSAVAAIETDLRSTAPAGRLIGGRQRREQGEGGLHDGSDRLSSMMHLAVAHAPQQL